MRLTTRRLAGRKAELVCEEEDYDGRTYVRVLCVNPLPERLSLKRLDSLRDRLRRLRRDGGDPG